MAGALALRTDKPTAQILEITPARAKLILEHCNERNRFCESRRVTQYARDMRDDGWLFTGEAIKVSREGQLLDGQHRLWAILEANITLRLLVITGLDPRAQEVMDTKASHAGYTTRSTSAASPTPTTSPPHYGSSRTTTATACRSKQPATPA